MREREVRKVWKERKFPDALHLLEKFCVARSSLDAEIQVLQGLRFISCERI